ncbi:hypothetical protein GJ496_007143 [Pomphorhynchus laevis]|nr:hypothetical protein GJ496_007143 [Pomphorhynchus laevis]
MAALRVIKCSDYCFSQTHENWRFPIESFSSQKQNNLQKRKLPKNVRKFYKQQNSLISAFEGIHNDALNSDSPPAHNFAIPEKFASRTYKYALLYSRATLGLNVVLMIAKVVATALSSSISIVGALLDSIVDIISGLVMWWAVRSSRKRDPFNYPQGRSRIEPIGIIILCVIMSVASAELIISAIQRIVNISSNKPVSIHLGVVTVSIMTCTILLKLLFYLLSLRISTPGVDAVALDNKNDVLSNLASLIFGLLGTKVSMYFDPVGAILIAIYIMYSWVNQGWGQIKILVGYTADSHFLQKIAFVCINHSDKIKQLDTVRAFHFGANYLVEVDIVLPETMTLKEAHDIGEPLQRKLEQFPNVDRAFVHLDYEFLHKPWIEHKIV